MSNLNGSAVYQAFVRQLETTDPAHPDTWDPIHQVLINNDVYLKGRIDELDFVLDFTHIVALKDGANAKELDIYGTTTGNKRLRLGHDGVDAFIYNSGVGVLNFGINSNAIFGIDPSSNVAPLVDNARSLGSATYRWSNVESVLATIGIPTNRQGMVYVGSDTIAVNTFHTASSSAEFASLNLARSRGTQASQSDVQNNDVLGVTTGLAYSGGTLFNTVRLQYVVDGSFTTGQRPPSRLEVYTNVANTVPALALTVTSQGNTVFSGYAVLKVTDTDGTIEGAVWYDASEQKLKFRDASGVRTITST